MLQLNFVFAHFRRVPVSANRENLTRLLGMVTTSILRPYLCSICILHEPPPHTKAFQRPDERGIQAFQCEYLPCGTVSDRLSIVSMDQTHQMISGWHQYPCWFCLPLLERYADPATVVGGGVKCKPCFSTAQDHPSE